MAVTCSGITAYDLRVSVKAVTAEAIGIGESVYISTDGLAYLVDNGKNDVCHGWAIEAAAAGDQITIVNKCRMRVATTQTIGARAYTGAVAGGSAPSTTLAANGIVVGYAITATLLLLEAPTPAADG
jgi:predicted transcriptional regulator